MRHKFFLLVVIISISAFLCSYPADAQDEVKVTSVGVVGNERVNTNYILSIVNTKPGSILSRDVLQADANAIYEQGSFSYADFDIRPEGGGVSVMFNVQENIVIESIKFIGNTVYTDDQLRELLISQAGNVFNRRIFRNDMNRIQEKYHNDGYVMARVSDTPFEGGNISVIITEPKVRDVIIQGNVKTKTYVIRREIKIEDNGLLNINHLRHQISKLQGLGYFDDVNLAYDFPDEETVDLIITVKEKRTASVGINLGYGTESGMSGGLTYSDTNVFGRGMDFEIGFNEGDEASYWTTFSSPYMDAHTFGWRVGASYSTNDDRYYYLRGRKQFEYDTKNFSVFAGLGKKFTNEDWSWFLTLRHRNVKYEDIHNAIPGYLDDITMWGGTNQTAEFSLTWDKRDEYSPYPKGMVWDTYLEQAVQVLGGEYDYLKYWTQARLYAPLNKMLEEFADAEGAWTDENPLLFAARLRIGSSTKEELPSFARYSLGGMNSLRGYNSRSFEGSNFYLGNFELRVPVNSALSLVGFYDIGNADSKMDWSNYHDDYGFGVRVKTPFGNLRLDYAKGKEENRTYFGFGEMF